MQPKRSRKLRIWHKEGAWRAEWWIANVDRHENREIQEKAKHCSTNQEDAAKVIQEFEEIFQNKSSDIVWLAYYQGKILQKFREKKNLLAIWFKIALRKVIGNYPKIKDSSLPLHFFKLKLIKKNMQRIYANLNR